MRWTSTRRALMMFGWLRHDYHYSDAAEETARQILGIGNEELPRSSVSLAQCCMGVHRYIISHVPLGIPCCIISWLGCIRAMGFRGTHSPGSFKASLIECLVIPGTIIISLTFIICTISILWTPWCVPPHHLLWELVNEIPWLGEWSIFFGLWDCWNEAFTQIRPMTWLDREMKGRETRIVSAFHMWRHFFGLPVSYSTIGLLHTMDLLIWCDT